MLQPLAGGLQQGGFRITLEHCAVQVPRGLRIPQAIEVGVGQQDLEPLAQVQAGEISLEGPSCLSSGFAHGEHIRPAVFAVGLFDQRVGLGGIPGWRRGRSAMDLGADG